MIIQSSKNIYSGQLFLRLVFLPIKMGIIPVVHRSETMLIYIEEKNKGETMQRAFTRLLKQNQKGITGIETAIILIAFVVVAAVFAYVVLSAGLFSSQKSQEAVYSGIKTTQNTIEVKGGIIAVAETAGNNGVISQFSFTLTNAIGAGMQDFTPPLATGTDGRCPANSPNKVVISYVDSYQKVDDLFWTLTKIGASGNDYLLDSNEVFQITVGSTTAGLNGGNLVNSLTTHPLSVNTPFTIEVKPPLGAVLIMERTTPAYIEHVMNLH
jgi:archaeal flagellin FlaB